MIDTFALWFSAAMATLIAGLFFAMPALVRPTLPLGVSIPQRRVAEPIVRGAIRQFRIELLGAWIIGLVLAGILAVRYPAGASIFPVLAVLVLGSGAYVVSRSAIVRAKRIGKWFENVPVRLSADIAAESTRAPLPVGWSMAAIMVLLAAATVGVALYSGLPNPVPTHWNAFGVADNYSTKSVVSVFGPLLVGLGVVALLFATALLARRSSLRATPADSPADSERRVAEQKCLFVSLLGQLCVVVAVQVSALAIVGWVAPGDGGLMLFGVGVPLAAMIAVIVLFALRYRRVVARWGAGGKGRPDSPDDDRFWKAGMLYVNGDDPALFVPKRFGIGWTINFGNVGGMVVGVVLLLVIVGSVVTAILAPGA